MTTRKKKKKSPNCHVSITLFTSNEDIFPFHIGKKRINIGGEVNAAKETSVSGDFLLCLHIGAAF